MGSLLISVNSQAGLRLLCFRKTSINAAFHSETTKYEGLKSLKVDKQLEVTDLSILLLFKSRRYYCIICCSNKNFLLDKYCLP